MACREHVPSPPRTTRASTERPSPGRGDDRHPKERVPEAPRCPRRAGTRPLGPSASPRARRERRQRPGGRRGRSLRRRSLVHRPIPIRSRSLSGAGRRPREVQKELPIALGSRDGGRCGRPHSVAQFLCPAGNGAQARAMFVRVFDDAPRPTSPRPTSTGASRGRPRLPPRQAPARSLAGSS